MRFRILAAAIVAVLAVGGATVAFGASGHERKATKPSAAVEPKPRAAAETAVALKAAKGCRTVGCFNRVLRRIVKAVAQLQRDTYKCERYVDVTQYGDYLGTDGANTYVQSGLDYTYPGDAPTDRMLVLVC